MSRTFTPEAVRAYRQSAQQLAALLHTTDDPQQIGEAIARHDIILLQAWGIPMNDLLAWAFALGQVDHEGRPL